MVKSENEVDDKKDKLATQFLQLRHLIKIEPDALPSLYVIINKHETLKLPEASKKLNFFPVYQTKTSTIFGTVFII